MLATNVLDPLAGLTNINMPINPRPRPITCFVEIDSFNQKYAIKVVRNAVVPFSIPSIFEVAPSEAKAKSVNGIALLKIAIIKIPGKWDLNNDLYFCFNKSGIKTKPAISNLKVTKRIGPKSTAEIFINMKALPQIAASVVNKNQSLDSIGLIWIIKVEEF